MNRLIGFIKVKIESSKNLGENLDAKARSIHVLKTCQVQRYCTLLIYDLEKIIVAY